MPETIIEPPVVAATTEPPVMPVPDLSLYAGKLKGPLELENATRALTAKLIEDGVPLAALPANVPLFGEGAPFKDVAALEADYLAKEKLQGKLSPAKPVAGPTVEIKAGEAPQIPEVKAPVAPAVGDDDPDYEQIVAKAGLKLTDLATEFAKNERCTDDQYATLKKAGRGRKEVDALLSMGLRAARADAQDITKTLTALAGGEQGVQTVLSWAAGNYTAAEQADLNARLRNRSTADIAMKQMLYDYGQKSGTTGSRPLVDGGGATTTTGGAYSDPNEARAIQKKVSNGTATANERARFIATPSALLLK